MASTGEVSLRREFNLDGRPPGPLLRLRIPIPYEDPAQEAIKIEPILPPGERIQLRRARESLEVRLASADAPEQTHDGRRATCPRSCTSVGSKWIPAGLPPTLLRAPSMRSILAHSTA